MLSPKAFTLANVYFQKKREYRNSFWTSLEAIFGYFYVWRYFGLALRAEKVNPVEFVGVSGSIKIQANSVKIQENEFEPVIGENRYYQLKFPISYNVWLTRRLKVTSVEIQCGQINIDPLDIENYGELIAGRISEGLTKQAGTTFKLLSPHISFLADLDKKTVFTASLYLQNDPPSLPGEEGVSNLVQFTEKNNIGRERGGQFKYYNYVPDGQAKKREDVECGTLPSEIRQGVANSMVLSAVLGDHDVNPGNLMIVSQQGKLAVGRIDFGHAFNNLITASKQFGGGYRHPGNFMLDFLNRETVANFPRPAPSKLWRNYAGFMPSEEMANALESINADWVSAGIDSAREEFMLLIAQLEKNNDQKGIHHLKKTLAAIYKNIDGTKLSVSGLQAEGVVGTVLERIQSFVKGNCEQANQVAKIMRLQLNVDRYLDDSASCDIELLKKQFNEINAGKEPSQFIWIKNDSKRPAFVGDLDAYINLPKRREFAAYSAAKQLLFGPASLSTKQKSHDDKAVTTENRSRLKHVPHYKPLSFLDNSSTPSISDGKSTEANKPSKSRHN